MKYISRYKLFEYNQNDKLIDYKLIADLKDLSMDLFDLGFTMEVDFRYNDGRLFGDVHINHDEEYYSWNKNYCDDGPVEYQFTYFENMGYDEPICKIEEEVMEIDRIIKAMYPNENIEQILF